DLKKTKAQLIKELEELRKQNTEMAPSSAEQVLFENNIIGIGISTKKGGIIKVNNALLKMTGYNEKEILEKNLKDVFFDSNVREEKIRKIEKERKVANQIVQITNKQGKTFWASITKFPIKFNGKDALLSTVFDITLHKQTAEALKKEHEQFLAIFDGIDETMYISDPKSYKILYVNKHLQKKYSKDLVGGLCYKEFQGFDKPCDFCTNKIILDSKGETYQWEYHNPSLNKDFMIFDRIIAWPDGRDVRFELAIDNSECILAEQELKIRLNYETGLANCSQTLLEDAENALDITLSHLLKASNVSRVYMFESFTDPHDGLCARQTHEVCAQGVSPEIDNAELQHLVFKDGFGRWKEELSKGNPIVGLVESFPQGERDILEPQSILSILVLPIWVGGEFYGFIGFDEIVTKRKWSEEDVRLLRTAAEIIGIYIESKQREEAHRNSEERLGLAMEAANDGMWDWKITKDEVYFDPQYFKMIGYEPFEFPGVIAEWEKRVHPEDLEQALIKIKEHVTGKTEQYNTEFRFKSKDGSWVWVLGRGKIVEWDSNGNPARMIGTHTDITNQKLSEKKIRQQNEFLENILESLTHPFYVVDVENYNIKIANSAAMSKISSKKLYCYGLSHKRNKPCDGIEHPCPIKIMKKTKKPVTVEHIHFDKDGKPLYSEVSGYPILDSKGEVTQIIEYCLDISERKKAEEKAIKLNEELEQRVIERTSRLEEVNKELEAFSYSVSHDLRAPLRSIGGFSTALLEDYSDKLDDEGFEFLVRIKESGKNMAQLIDDLLSLSRITRSHLRRRKIDLSIKASEIANDLQKTQPNRSVEFVISKGITIDADERLIYIVMSNLLENAWKFTEKKTHAKIEIFNTEENGEIVYCVRDNGAGFNMAYAQKLFGAFQRLHSRREFEGTGIGLATVQRIINRHNGRVWAEGKINQGSTFYFTLGKGGE
ncbi:PAS domain S-box protein, partial [Candidatus Latescibacterota bacterium]